MIYRSKKVWWGAIIFVAPSLVGIIVGLMLMYTGIFNPMSQLPGEGRVVVAMCGAMTIAICGILVWSYITASYEITPEELIVRFGPLRPRYRLSSIAKSIPTRLQLGPAWSFATCWDMVYIKFRGPSGRVTGLPLAISPANKTEFLRELAARVPGLGERDESGQGHTTGLESRTQ